jgi:hypothetical protein
VSKFDALKRERLLAFVEAGWPLTDAAAASDVSRQTVSTWLTRGRHDPSSEAGAFVARFNAAKAAANGRGVPAPPITEQPIRPGAQGFAPYADTIWRWVQEGDPFVALSPGEMSELTPEQRAHYAVDEYRELDGGRVLVLFRRSGRGKTSGLEIDQLGGKGADLFHVRGGKVTRLINYWDRDRALADHGLED